MMKPRPLTLLFIWMLVLPVQSQINDVPPDSLDYDPPSLAEPLKYLDLGRCEPRGWYGTIWEIWDGREFWLAMLVAESEVAQSCPGWIRSCNEIPAEEGELRSDCREDTKHFCATVKSCRSIFSREYRRSSPY